jgi:hypothetical protein
MRILTVLSLIAATFFSPMMATKAEAQCLDSTKVLQWIKRRKNVYLTRKAKLELLSDSAGVTNDVRIDGEQTEFLMWLPAFNSSPEDWNTAAHEICHVVNYVFCHIGHKIEAKNDETQAYLIGWLTQKFATFVRK